MSLIITLIALVGVFTSIETKSSSLFVIYCIIVGWNVGKAIRSKT